MIFYVMMLFFGMTINSANATMKLPGLLLGMLIGSYLGVHTAIKKGNAWVKPLFAVVTVLSTVKMILD